MTRENGNIYCVTVMDRLTAGSPEEIPGGFSFCAADVLPEGVRRRTMAWYGTEQAAREAVETNDGDIHEKLYSWAVIEEVPEGGWPDARAVAWYRYDAAAERWAASQPPVEAHLLGNFSIG